MRWLLIFSIVVGGLGEHNVLLVNETGLPIARIKIDDRVLDTIHSNETEVLIKVTPAKHDLTIVFRGGAMVEWPKFDFKGVREIIFGRVKNEIEAHTE